MIIKETWYLNEGYFHKYVYMAEKSWYYVTVTMIGLNLNDTIITPYIQMEFFYFKTKFFGLHIIDIDNQRTLID